ncbi:MULTISPECIES: hypothetical protein [unclassified Pseudomonas]|uniref:hypothetical protein n=1 Tax=Pseudomonas TaxID=286 RepID=UPI002248DA74|nr:hypothetical protein [Pseudomonas sp. DCB_BG]MCX2710178.1 hypothetical protein [Pseudomonas sp. DCB_BG]
MGRQPGIQDEWKRYLQPEDKDQPPPRDSSERLADYNADYVSTILLVKLYFGNKTIAAINALSKTNSPWWMKSENEQFAVLTAMTEELKFGLPTFTSTLTNSPSR